ncbi:MAG: COX15/CtaA family protein [Elusimicrobia bacterium]|nr:COX15/CtaA family protein [Elusimicrobiota bacterium]MDE2313924.1 COX15/CtaA family protein [Elusimicrobiota bacterium]
MRAAHRLAQATAAAAFLLIIAGALVTSTGSSLAIPDWPLAYGKLIPPMHGGIPFEWGHRVLAGCVTLLTFFLAGVLWRLETRRGVRLLALAAAGGIVLQAIFGGMTVLLRLPPELSIAHACLGPVVFCLLVALAQTTSPWYADPATTVKTPSSAKFKKIGWIFSVVVFLQILWGAIIRHMGQAVGLHILWAFVVLGMAIFVLVKSYRPKIPQLSRPALLLVHLVPLQFILGFISLKILFSSTFNPGFGSAAALTASHVAVGDLILATTVVWLLRAYKTS